MEYNNLTPQEQDILSILVDTGQIKAADLPEGIWVGLDSMGPARNAKTDELFPEIPDVLRQFTETMQEYDLGLVVATNGPDKEGLEILESLDPSKNPRAFAVTEGGGKYIYFGDNKSRIVVLAAQEDIDKLGMLEEKIKQDPLMRAMLEDKEEYDGEAPVRTAYETNIVLTIPSSSRNFVERLRKNGLNVPAYIGILSDNYVEDTLEYARRVFAEAISELGLEWKLKEPLIKKQNRRIYISPAEINHKDPDTVGNLTFDKAPGAYAASEELNAEKGYQIYTQSMSIYVADGLIDRTRGEGNMVLAKSEKSMLVNENTPRDKARLGINVTMNDETPGMSHLEGVKILNIGSGAKALEAINFLYRTVHAELPNAA